MLNRWTTTNMPPQAGKTAIVTGGSSGLGYETAKALARAGAAVTIASNRVPKGQAALEALRRDVPGGKLDYLQIDTSSLKSVGHFVEQICARQASLDILINCAGICSVPERLTSIDGFEKQLATNYLGHFALTGRLLPLLTSSPAARVVSFSSLAHRIGTIHFEDLQLVHSYDPLVAYAQSKLAMLIFGRELDRRARERGLSLLSMPVHPGGAKTEIFDYGAFMAGGPRRFRPLFQKTLMILFAQSAAQGALPALYAATSPDAKGGEYYGPSGPFGIRGYPAVATMIDEAKDPRVAEKLWAVSEQLTGVTYW